MAMTESQDTHKLCMTLTAAGAKCISLVASQMQEPGLPDRLVVHELFFGFIEAKRAVGNVSVIQDVKIRQLVERGAPVLLAWYGDRLVTLHCVNSGQQVEISRETALSGKRLDGIALLHEMQLLVLTKH